MSWRAALVLGVLLFIREPAATIPCPPPPPPELVRIPDGAGVPSYEWRGGGSVYSNAIACFKPGGVHAEEWTDYPENGGEFIRRLPDVLIGPVAP